MSDDRPSGGTEPAGTTVLDEVGHRVGFRAFFARYRWLDVSYRVGVGVVGAAIVVMGVILIPLPGPGWLIVFAGLAVLATEFVWAERLLNFGRRKVRRWTQWAGAQALFVRFLIGFAGAAFIAGLVWVFFATQGLPDWVTH